MHSLSSISLAALCTHYIEKNELGKLQGLNLDFLNIFQLYDLLGKVDTSQKEIAVYLFLLTEHRFNNLKKEQAESVLRTLLEKPATNFLTTAQCQFIKTAIVKLINDDKTSLEYKKHLASVVVDIYGGVRNILNADDKLDFLIYYINHTATNDDALLNKSLNIAGENNRPLAVKWLFDFVKKYYDNKNPFTKTNDAVCACAWKGHAEVLTLLLEFGFTYDRSSHSQLTPFLSACFYGHTDIMDIFFKHTNGECLKDSLNDKTAEFYVQQNAVTFNNRKATKITSLYADYMAWFENDNKTIFSYRTI